MNTNEQFFGKSFIGVLMFPIERYNLIINLLEEKSSMTVKELSLATNATTATIRRDLEKLDREKAIKRTHGGAVRLNNDIDPPFNLRDSEKEAEKIKIARVAIKFINDGDTLFFDSSTTVMRLIPFLSSKNGITVITNGIKTAFELGKIGVNTICTGGELTNCNTLIGLEAINAIEKYHVDKFFFSCRAVNELGAYESSTQLVEIKQAMNKNAKESYLLADSGKLNKTAFIRLNLNKIDTLITDSQVDYDWGLNVIWDKK
ncbi:MAG TPA: DeoR/GlpR family DNA-binding transcription regulator [Clostridia bacterium]|nr:DeoR/GlpR family DNA-binding transcription regulator [Clostridia bacterium]